MPPLVVHSFFFMDSKSLFCETSCLLGVLHPFMNPHSTNSWFSFVDPMCPSKSCIPNNCLSLGPTRPILGKMPLALCFIHSNCFEFLWVCRWDHTTFPTWLRFQGHTVPLLGHAPKSSHPCSNTTQVSINRSKASKVCASLVLHLTIVHTRCSYTHQKFSFSQPITYSLWYLFVISLNLPKERACSVGVTRDLKTSSYNSLC